MKLLTAVGAWLGPLLTFQVFVAMAILAGFMPWRWFCFARASWDWPSS